MKALLALSLLALPGAARAETFVCTFTEPFVTVSYDTATQTLVEKEAIEKKGRVLRAISFQVAGPSLFLLKDAKGREVARLELKGAGSDGMSDRVFPYSVTYKDMLGNANSGIGGCESSLLKAKDGQ